MKLRIFDNNYILKAIACVVLMITILFGSIACNPTITEDNSPRLSTEYDKYPEAVLGKWGTISSGNDVTDLLINNGEIWAATTGGVVRWNVEDGTYWRYTVDDGLSSNYVKEIIKDGNDNIWISSNRDGISCFDGSEWKSFNSEDGIVSKEMLKLYADKNGHVWVSSFGGVSYYDGIEWQKFTSDGLDTVNVIFADSQGNIWFSNRHEEVICYDGEEWKHFDENDGLAQGAVSTCFEDNKGNIWFGSELGNVTCYNGSSWEQFSISDRIPRPYIQNIMCDQDGNIWVTGFSETVVRYDGSEWRSYTTKDGLRENTVYILFSDGEDRLCAATDKGLSYYENECWWPFKSDIPAKPIRAVIKDDRGTLWFGTGKGIFSYDNTLWKAYFTDDTLPDNVVYSLAEDSKKNIWIGTRDGSVSRYDGNNWQVFSPDEVHTGSILYLLADHRLEIWAIGDEGVARFNGTEWIVVSTASGLNEDTFVPIFEDSSGNVWLGTSNNGVRRFNGDTWNYYNLENRLCLSNIVDINQDNQGNIWCAGDGISCFDGTNWQHYSTTDEISRILPGTGKYVWFITKSNSVILFDGSEMHVLQEKMSYMPWLGGTLVDSQDNLWISIFSSNNGRLYRYNGTTWETYTSEESLAHYQISSLIEDKQGGIWAITSRGVSYYYHQQWYTFTSLNGLSNNNVLCVMEDSEGRIWFGTQGGVSYYIR